MVRDRWKHHFVWEWLPRCWILYVHVYIPSYQRYQSLSILDACSSLLESEVHLSFSFIALVDLRTSPGPAPAFLLAKYLKIQPHASELATTLPNAWRHNIPQSQRHLGDLSISVRAGCLGKQNPVLKFWTQISCPLQLSFLLHHLGSLFPVACRSRHSRTREVACQSTLATSEMMENGLAAVGGALQSS